MKHLLLLFSCLLIFTTTALAQTELWRIYSRGADIGFTYAAGDSGNIYILGLNQPIAQDTLRKINKDGVVLWDTTFDGWPQRTLFNGSGIYCILQDSILIIDDNRNFLVVKDTEMARMYMLGCVDTNRNLYYYASNSGENYVKKMKSDGSIEWKTLLSDKRLNKYTIVEGPSYFGPYVDPKGNIWAGYQITYDRSAHSTKHVQYTEVFKINGESGKVLFHATPLNEVVVKDGVDISTGWEFSLAGEYLVSAGTYSTYVEKTKKGNDYVTYKENWRIMVVTPTGKKKIVVYKGKGYYAEDSKRRIYFEPNHPIGMITNSSGSFYITGEICNGKYIDNSATDSTYEIQGILLKFDPATMKIIWSKVLPYPHPGYPIMSKSEDIYVDWVNGGSRMSIYDKDGNLSATTLSFYPESVAVRPYDIPELNRSEQGNLYIHNGTEFLIKYALPTSTLLGESKGALIEAKPYQFELNQNYPNPFNPTTTIDFSLAEASIVTLKVYNILGQEVAVLIDHEVMDEGDQTIEFDASRLPSGVYFYDLLSNSGNGHSNQSIKKMMLMK